MAIGGVVIQFLADSTKAVKNIGNLTGALGKVDDQTATVDRALTDVQRGMDKTGDAARTSARNFDSIGAEAEDAARRLRLAGQKMGDGIHTGAQQIGHETDSIRGHMREAGAEAGGEFIQNIAEGIGSGQANLNDVVNGTLGGITNLAATLPGIGTAAAGVAGGIALVFAAVQSNAQKAKDALDGMRGALDGITNLASKAAREAVFKKWVEDAQQVPGKIKAVSDAITTAKVDAEDFQRALTGDPAAIAKVRDALVKQGQQIIRNKQETGKITAEQQKYLDTLPVILQDLNKNKNAASDWADEQAGIKALTGDTEDAQKGVTREVKKTKEQADGLKETMDAASKDRSINWNIDFNGGMTMGEFLEGLHGRSVTLGAATPAAATRAAPVVMNFTVEGVQDPYAFARIAETQLAKWGRVQGRTRSGRAVAW